MPARLRVDYFEADNYMLLLNWISSGPIISVPPRGPITRVPLWTMTGHTREQGTGGHTSLSGASKYIPDYCAAIAPQVSLVDTIAYIFFCAVSQILLWVHKDILSGRI